jgi:hypothetical protein
VATTTVSAPMSISPCTVSGYRTRLFPLSGLSPSRPGGPLSRAVVHHEHRHPGQLPDYSTATDCTRVAHRFADTCCVSAPGCPVDCHDSLGGVATLSQPGPSR